MTPVLLVLNAGSSSLKFQIFDARKHENACAIAKGLYEGLGGAARFSVCDAEGAKIDEIAWGPAEAFVHEDALVHLVSWLRTSSWWT